MDYKFFDSFVLCNFINASFIIYYIFQKPLFTSDVSPFREICIIYYCFTLQALVNLTLILVNSIVIGCLVIAKHLENVQTLFKRCALEEFPDAIFNQTVLYHQKTLDFHRFYNTKMRLPFTAFFILQFLVMAIMVIAIQMVNIIYISIVA